MPELPEVEITTKNLLQILKPPVKIEKFIFFRKDLRHLIPIKKIKQLDGQVLLNIRRRAKFIIFEFSQASLVGHLGMTGSWRFETEPWQRTTHDHIALQFNKNQFIVYHDPRRFGEFDYFEKSNSHLRFINLGVEPLDKNTNWTQLSQQFKRMQSPIKSVLMNQKYLVGVGNIYASEALFRAGIKPLKKASAVTYKQYQALWAEVVHVLQSAIQAGGSTIQDFRNGYGERGDFQNHFLVYGRDDQACRRCGSLIKSIFISGRSTFWCPSCQK